MNKESSILGEPSGGNGVPTGPPQAVTSSAENICERCGEPVRVRILEGYSDAQPVIRSFCMQCVEQVHPAKDARTAARPRVRVWVLPVLIGLGLGLTALLTDLLIPDAAPGFGMHQRTGLILGTLLGLVGVLLRVDLIVIAGMFIFVGALSADWFGLSRSPGFGWKQRAVLGLSLVLVLGALVTHLVQRMRHRYSSVSRSERNVPN